MTAWRHPAQQSDMLKHVLPARLWTNDTSSKPQQAAASRRDQAKSFDWISVSQSTEGEIHLKKSLLLRPGQVIRHVCASGIAMFWGSRQAILAASEAPEGSGRLNPYAKTAQYRPEICTMSRNRQNQKKKHRKVIHPIFLATLVIYNTYQYLSSLF